MLIKLEKGKIYKINGVIEIKKGKIELLYKGKPIKVVNENTRTGLEVLLSKGLPITIRALEESRIEEIKLDKKLVLNCINDNVSEIVINYFELLISLEHNTLHQFIERLIKTSKGYYPIINISKFSREFGYTRKQFYRAIEKLEAKGYIYDKKNRHFKKQQKF